MSSAVRNLGSTRSADATARAAPGIGGDPHAGDGEFASVMNLAIGGATGTAPGKRDRGDADSEMSGQSNPPPDTDAPLGASAASGPRDGVVPAGGAAAAVKTVTAPLPNRSQPGVAAKPAGTAIPAAASSAEAGPTIVATMSAAPADRSAPHAGPRTATNAAIPAGPLPARQTTGAVQPPRPNSPIAAIAAANPKLDAGRPVESAPSTAMNVSAPPPVKHRDAPLPAGSAGATQATAATATVPVPAPPADMAVTANAAGQMPRTDALVSALSGPVGKNGIGESSGGAPPKRGDRRPALSADEIGQLAATLPGATIPVLAGDPTAGANAPTEQISAAAIGGLQLPPSAAAPPPDPSTALNAKDDAKPTRVAVAMPAADRFGGRMRIEADPMVAARAIGQPNIVPPTEPNGDAFSDTPVTAPPGTMPQADRTASRDATAAAPTDANAPHPDKIVAPGIGSDAQPRGVTDPAGAIAPAAPAASLAHRPADIAAPPEPPPPAATAQPTIVGFAVQAANATPVADRPVRLTDKAAAIDASSAVAGAPPPNPATVTANAAPAATTSLGTPPAFSEALANHVLTLATSGHQEATLQLQPPQLGDMTVRVAIQGRDVSAWFGTAQPQVQQAVNQALDQLRLNLAGAGFNLTGAWVGADTSGAQRRYEPAALPARRAGFSMPAIDVASNERADATRRPSGVNIYV